MKNNFKNDVLFFVLSILIFHVFNLDFSNGRSMLVKASTFNWQEAEFGTNYRDIENIADVSSSPDGMNLIAVRSPGQVYLSQDGGVSWIEKKPVGESGSSWSSSVISQDGSRILVGAYASRLYLSTDSGDNWAETGPSVGTDKNWSLAAMSSDGSIMIVGEGWGGGRLYLSVDGGDNWAETGPAVGFNREWRAVDMSSDGSKILVANSNYLYFSDDGGDSWTEDEIFENWQKVDISPDGTQMIANSLESVYVHDGIGWNEMLIPDAVEPLWRGVATNGDGTLLLAGAIGQRLFKSTDGGTIWSQFGPEPNPENYWDIFSSSNGSRIIAGTQNGPGKLFISADSGVNWGIGKIIVDDNRGWLTSASDDDGSNLIAAEGADYGRLFTSSDFGETWTERRPVGDFGRYWQAVASSSNGKYLVASILDGLIYISQDYGSTWNPVTASPPENPKSWLSLSMSGDGAKIIAGMYSGKLYVSSDFGVTWNETEPAGNQDENWKATAISSDGFSLFAGVNSGRLYKSSDFGENWDEMRPLGNNDGYWNSIASSSDGSKLITVSNDGEGQSFIFVSSDSGDTWTETQPTADGYHDWWIADINNDGSRLVTSSDTDGRLYVSSDFGENWTEEKPAGDTDQFWDAISLSGDGSQLLAGAFNGRLYLGQAGESNEPINIGPTAEKFQLDVESGFISIEGANPLSTSKVTFETEYTIITGDARIVLQTGTEMTKTGGGNFNFSEMTMENITDTLKNSSVGNIAGAVNIGIPNLRLSFSSPITVTIPVASSLNGQTLNIWYQNAGDSTWTQGPTCAVSDAKCVFQTDHATSYSAGDQPSDGNVDVPEKAKIDSWKAYLIQDNSKCSTKLKLEIKGKHFDKHIKVKIGNKNASSIKRSSSKKLTATFCFEALTNIKTDLKRKITVKNPDTNSTKAKTKIDLSLVSARFGENDFNPATFEGVKNIQQALVKLKFLQTENVTGFFGPMTIEALKAFQNSNGISPTGFVGQLTREKLAEKCH